MRVLIDTCVIVDVLQAREPFRDDAEKIFLLVADNSFDGFITAKSLTDIYYLTRRLTHSEKDTRKILTKLIMLFSLLDTAGIDCNKAISSEIADYEDAIMVETAVRSQIDCIVTRNLKDYMRSPIPIYSPAEFTGLFE